MTKLLAVGEVKGLAQEEGAELVGIAADLCSIPTGVPG